MLGREHARNTSIITGLIACIALMAACATAASAPDAPQISNFKFIPDSFSRGQLVTLSFDYRNVKGGLGNASIELDYRGGTVHHTRQPSRHGSLIKQRGGTSESGTFQVELHISASDPPPLDIWYFLRVRDTTGRRSNEETAKVTYLP